MCPYIHLAHCPGNHIFNQVTDMNQIKTRPYLTALAIVLLFAGLFLFTVMYFQYYLHPATARSVCNLTKGWSYHTASDQTYYPLKSLSGDIPGINGGDTVYLSRTLPSAGGVLLVKYYYQSLSVSIGGKLRCETPAAAGENPGAGLIFLPLQPSDFGEELQIAITSPYTIYAGMPCQIYMGDTQSLMGMIFSEALPHLFFLFICMLLGFFFLLYSTLSIVRKENRWDTLFFGLFSVLLGFFAISRDDLMYLLFPPIPASEIPILLHAIYLIPLMAYFSCIFTKFRKAVYVPLALISGNAILMLLICFTGITGLPRMIPAVNRLLLFSFLPVICIVIYELIHKNRIIRFLFPVILLVIALSAGTIIFYFNLQIPSAAMYLNSVFLLVIAIWIYHMREFLRQRISEKKELQAMQFMMTQAQKDYENLTAHTQEIRQMRHEIGHHIAAIQILNDAGEHERLTRYLETITEQFRQSAAPYSENLLVNGILADRLGHAGEAGIRIDTDISIPSVLPFEDPDLFSLLTNMLDNAIESNLRLPAEDRWLQIQLCQKGNFLIISCANAALPSPEDPLRSVKTGDHGYGIRIMRSIVKKYDSTLNIKREDDSFSIGIILTLPN